MDYNKLSKEELLNEKALLEEEFEKCKEQLVIITEKMEFMSENYDSIQEILDKRNGKTKKQEEQ